MRLSRFAPVAAAARVALAALSLVTLAPTACVSMPPAVVRRTTARPPTARAPIGLNDVFAVRVFGEQDLSQEYRVAADGTIDFPYVGRLEVAGMEPPDLAERLRRELRDREILRAPSVSVMLTHVNSRRVSILGQVQRPGTVDFVQGMDIIMAISTVGGFTALAQRNSVRVTRRLPGGVTRSFTIHVEDIAHGQADNIELQPNDIVFVPESPV
jgi:protein involved in polysaccharide export with SLBB domain